LNFGKEKKRSSKERPRNRFSKIDLSQLGQQIKRSKKFKKQKQKQKLKQK